MLTFALAFSYSAGGERGDFKLNEFLTVQGEGGGFYTKWLSYSAGSEGQHFPLFTVLGGGRGEF